MHDAHLCFGENGQLEILQMVVILMYRTCQRIFDRDYRSAGLPVFHTAKDIFEASARQYGNVVAQQLPCRFFAESAPFSLKCDFFLLRAVLHLAPSHLRASAAGRPSKSSTRSTLWFTISSIVSGRL